MSFLILRILATKTPADEQTQYALNTGIENKLTSDQVSHWNLLLERYISLKKNILKKLNLMTQQGLKCYKTYQEISEIFCRLGNLLQVVCFQIECQWMCVLVICVYAVVCVWMYSCSRIYTVLKHLGCKKLFVYDVPIAMFMYMRIKAHVANVIRMEDFSVLCRQIMKFDENHYFYIWLRSITLLTTLGSQGCRLSHQTQNMFTIQIPQ